MRALTVLAGTPHSMKLDEVPEPLRSDGDVLVETFAIGICTVNANRRHYQAAAAALARADPDWLKRLITRRVPLEPWQDILEKRDDDIKVVLQFAV